MLLATIALAVPVFLAPPPVSQVWIVDANGAGDFTDIPPAVAAAAAGDTIIVRPGTYSAFELTKALTVRSADSTQPFVVGTTRVHDVDGAGLQRLLFNRLELERVGGPSFVHTCSTIALFGPDAQSQQSGLHVRDHCKVALVNVQANGGIGTPTSAQAGALGCEIDDSEVWIAGGRYVGGSGNAGFSGGAGCVVRRSTVIANGIYARGGSGGSCSIPGCMVTGGTGVQLEDSTADLRGTAIYHELTGGSQAAAPGKAPALAASNSMATYNGFTFDGAVSGSGLTAIAQKLPTLHATVGWIGSPYQLFVDLQGPPNSTGLMIASLPIAPVPYVNPPALLSSLGVNMGQPLRLFGVNIGPSGVTSISTLLPNGLSFAGSWVALQAGIIDPSSGTMIGTPPTWILMPL